MGKLRHLNYSRSIVENPEYKGNHEFGNLFFYAIAVSINTSNKGSWWYISKIVLFMPFMENRRNRSNAVSCPMDWAV